MPGGLSMNKDELEGKVEKAKGYGKEQVGKATDDPDLEAEGTAQRGGGEMQEGFGKARRKVGDAVKKIGDAIWTEAGAPLKPRRSRGNVGRTKFPRERRSRPVPDRLDYSLSANPHDAALRHFRLRTPE